MIDITPDDFTYLVETEKRVCGFRLRRYHADAHILIITIPTEIHERLHLALYQSYILKIDRMGLWKSWISIGATTLRAQGHPGGDGGESDSSGGPRPERFAHGSWPTLIIESGDSETLSELHRDMRWWFAASQHQVKIVVLVKFDHRQEAILLERWEEEPANLRLGATTTRQAAVLQPVIRQQINITQNATTSPVSYHVTRGALVLPFHLLFLRAPGPQEHDVIFSIQDLQEYAEVVWGMV